DALELGATHYLKKPIEPDELARALEHASRTSGMQRTHSSTELRAANDQYRLRDQFDAALSSLWIEFQPIVSVRSGRVEGYEVSVRTNEPALADGAALTEAAVALGRVHELGRKVRAEVAAMLESAPPRTLIYVSLHPQDLLDPE